MHGNSMAMRVVLTLVFALFALGISAQTVTGTPWQTMRVVVPEVRFAGA